MVVADSFDEVLARHTNELFREGSRYAAALGLSSCVLMSILQHLGKIRDMGVPILWAAICGGFALMVTCLGRKGWIRGSTLWAVVLLYTSLPSLIYVLAALQLPAGAATYITGLPTYLYFFLIAVSGFSFDKRLPVVAGVVAAWEYLLVFLVARPHMNMLVAIDPLMMQDLVSPVVYFFKALTMVFTGLVVGKLSSTLKQLLSLAVCQERP